MAKPLLISLVLLTSIGKLYSQSQVFQHLAQTNLNSSVRQIIYKDFFDLSRSIDSNYVNFPVHIVANENGVYLNIKGTGRLYQWDLQDQKFKRIDSTKLEGYNHGHLMYSYKDTIYSYGGYGFWTLYGITRYFSDVNRQWDLKKTNLLIPSEFKPNSAYYWIDQESGILYLTKDQFDLNNYSGLNRIDPALVYSFHINSGKWTALGSPLFKPQSSTLILGGLKNGLVYLENGKLKLMSFKGNSIHLISKEKSDSATAYIFGSTKHLYFSTDSKIYFADVKSGKVDSILIEPKDIGPIEQKVFFESPKIVSTKPFWVTSLILVGLAGSIFLLFKYKKRNQEPTSNKFLDLNHAELSFLQLLAQRGLKNEIVTISELNHFLGLSGKSPDIKKKYRSDFLNVVSTKLNHFLQDRDPIKRKRSLDDGRVFEYYIDPSTASKIIVLLENNQLSKELKYN